MHTPYPEITAEAQLEDLSVALVSQFTFHFETRLSLNLVWLLDSRWLFQPTQMYSIHSATISCRVKLTSLGRQKARFRQKWWLSAASVVEGSLLEAWSSMALMHQNRMIDTENELGSA
jgi:hypothetical protein